MKRTVANLAVLVGLLGSHAAFAGGITVFLAREEIRQDIQQDDVVKPGTRIETLGGGLVVLLESEMLTSDRSKECQFWTVIPSDSTHVVQSHEGKGCSGDERALDRALAAAQSGQGQVAHAAFQVVHLPGLGKGDVPPTASEAAAGEFAAALRKIPQDAPNQKGATIQPGLKDKMVLDKGHGGKVADWNSVSLDNSKDKEKEKAKTEKIAADKEREERLKAKAREEETKRRREAAETGESVHARGKRIDPATASPKLKTRFALAVIKGSSIEDLALETGVPAEVIKEWHARFIAGGQASFEDAPEVQCGEELSKLKEKIGELYLENDRLREICNKDRR